MARAVFYIKDKVQEVGYRAFVMERILETNLDGGAINAPEGGLKVLLEGEKSEIIAFVKRLKEEKPELAENPVLIGPEFDDSLEIPDTIRASHALEMNQFGKAVVYLDRIDKKLDGGFDSLGNKIDGLPDKIGEKLGSKFDELPKKISDELGPKFDELPKKISDELGPKFDELPKRISDALGKRFDELPGRIAKAIKAEN